MDAGAQASLFMLNDPDWREKIYRAGLLLLFVPPLGWPAALGYRKALIARLYSGEVPPLPHWRGHIWTHFREGIKAIAVIFAHYLPLYVTLALLLHSRGATIGLGWCYVALFFMFFSILSPLAFPLTVAYWSLGIARPLLSVTEAATFVLLYAVVTFFIPAGFLQVSLSGKYLSAFHFRSSCALLFRNFRNYLRAWYHSIIMSLCGHFALPFSPWGVLWCYLGIIFSFNQVLREDLARRGRLSPGSWFEKIANSEQLRSSQIPGSFRYQVLDAHGVETQALRCGPIFVPLPNLLTKFLAPRD